MSRVSDLLTSLAACLCVEMQREGAPELCYCGVVVGETATGDLAGCSDNGPCGMAWVRLSGSYPSTVVGAANVDPGNCGKALGLDIELGVMRCVPVADDNGNPPHPAAIAEAAALQVEDMLAMRRAVACCDALPNTDVVMGTYAPVGPLGLLGGGVWPISVMVL